MEIYKIQNNALPDGFPKIPCGTGKECQKLNDTFSLNKVIPWIENDGNLPVDRSTYIKIIKARSSHIGKSLNPTLVYKEPSLASDEEDFWSFDTLWDFFRIAERRGAAVCQLLKQCSDLELDGFMKSLQHKSYSLEQLKRLFASTKISTSNIWLSFDQTNPENLKQLKDELTGMYIPFGTGFLVGKNYLLTNSHILPNAEDAGKLIARFRYDRSSRDDKLQFVDYYLDPSSLASSPEEKLDYALVRLFALGEQETQTLTGEEKEKAITKIRRKLDLQFLEAGENFGWLPLFEDDALIAPPLSVEQVNEFQDQLKLDLDLLEKAQKFGLPGEPVNIIQHPRGRSKEIVFYSNRVQELNSRYLHYQADTDLGSSGSPVLNSQWQVVALHHAVLVGVNHEENKADEVEVTVKGSVGIRISEIVKDLKTFENLKKPQIAEFVRNFVIDSGAKPHRGNIYILAGMKRDEIPGIEDRNFNEAEIMVQLRDSIQDAEIGQFGERILTLKDYGYSVKTISNKLPTDYASPYPHLSYEEKLIRFWAEQRLREKDLAPGDIALKLSMEAYTEKQQTALKWGGLKVDLSVGVPRKKMRDNEFLRGVGIYYAGSSDERERQAELLLKALLNQKTSPKSNRTIETLLPNRGSRSDQTILGAISPIDPEKSHENEPVSGLPFCQDIGIPSFELRLGFVTNPADRREVTQHRNAITQGIAKGLLAWGNSINAIPVEIYQPRDSSSESDSSKQYFLSF